MKDVPNLDAAHLARPDLARLEPTARMTHPPRILLLYGSLRARSYSKLLTLEAERILRHLGAETRVFDPAGLPMPDSVSADHPKVGELRELSLWSEGQVWCSPERHGAVTGVFKCQIDWIPLALGSVRPTQGRTLAVMQVCGGSQSFNAVNGLRLLGRWMRMITIPNQSSVPKAFEEFDEAGRMRASAYYDRVVDVMEELAPLHVADQGSRRLSHDALQRARGRGGTRAGRLDLTGARRVTKLQSRVHPGVARAP